MSRVVWCALLMLSVLAVCFQAFRAERPFVPDWPPPPPPPPVVSSGSSSSGSPSSSSRGPCGSTEDCEPDLVCFRGSCMPKLRVTGECNPKTGEWILTRRRDGRDAVACKCRYPRLVSQTHEGGDCSYSMACRPHGRLESLDVDPLTDGRCACDEGYRPERDALHGPLCVARTVAERRAYLCGEDETGDASGFDGSYVADGRAMKRDCLRRQCTFDAVSGSTIRHARFDPEAGCVCDPRWGNVGVHVNHPSYLKTPGYNACVNVLREEPDDPVPEVRLHAYFYLLDRKPVAFVQFVGLDRNDVKPAFRRKLPPEGHLQVEETWPHDHMQRLLLDGGEFRTRTRYCEVNSWAFGTLRCVEDEVVEGPLIDCWHVTQRASGVKRNEPAGNPRVNLYRILYRFPACRFHGEDHSVSPTYRGRFVLNPHHLTYRGKQDVLRSNGLVMRSARGGAWTLDLAEPHNVRRYMHQPPGPVPDLNDQVCEAVANNEQVRHHAHKPRRIDKAKEG